MFLGRQDKTGGMDVMTLEAKKVLLAELENSLGSEHRSFTERRLAKIEDVLRPIYNAVPKNEHGLLGHSAVAFLLHRGFVVRHGWFIRGLDPEDRALTAFNASSTSTMLEDKVPSQIQEVFEQRIGGKGATLHELAVLMATLEHLVHKEAMARLEVVYQSQSFSMEDVVSEEEAREVFDSYMALFILGFLLPGNAATPSATQVSKLREQIPKVYPHWPEVQKFIQEVKTAVAPKRDYLYFADIANVIEEVGDRYGNWQDKECLALKNELLEIEDTTTASGGRVRLADFYKKAVDEEKFQFGESIDYLRQLGALDESDPANPRVLVANYVHSPSNCVASSSYYSVCCRNECEDLLGHLETQIAKPEATPEKIIALVNALPSSTVDGNRTLPQWLVGRLNEVAAHHQGTVPLHSRLFMQWMHFAYPRECPYPHLSGATSKTRVEDVIKQDLDNFVASKDEMMQHISVPLPKMTADADAMWTMEEELIMWHHAGPTDPSSSFRRVYFLGSLMSAALVLWWKFKISLGPSIKGFSLPSSSDKYYV